MGSLGSFALGFVMFMLTTPVRSESLVCVSLEGAACPAVTNCYTLSGWENVLGPLGCSRWAAVGVGLLVGLLARAVGERRARADR